MTRTPPDRSSGGAGDSPASSGGPDDNLTARTLSGVQWTYTKTLIGHALTLVAAAILARLLPPRTFGLVAMAGMALGFVHYFARMGLSRALIQRRDLSPEHIRAAFTSSVALGIISFVVVWAAAPYAALLFSEPELVDVVRVMGLAFPLSGFGMTAQALLHRRFAFRIAAIRSIGGSTIGAGTAIVLAISDFGVYALVYGALVGHGFQSMLSYLVERHDLRPILRREPYVDLVGFGSKVSLISFLEFLGHDLDTLLIGRWAGATPLGFYNRADLLLRLPTRMVYTNLSSVLFPAFSSIQTQVPRLRKAYLQAVEFTAAVAFPICAGLAVAAPEVIVSILGPQWLPAAPLVPFLAASAAASAIGHFGGVLCEALAMLREKIILTAVKVGVLAGLLYGASLLGPLYWFAVAISLAELAAFLAYAWLVGTALGLGSLRPLAVLARPMFAAVIVAAMIAVGRFILIDAGVPVLGVFLGEVSLGAIALLLTFRLGPLRPTRDLMFGRLGSAGLLRRHRRLTRILTLVLGRPRSLENLPA